MWSARRLSVSVSIDLNSNTSFSFLVQFNERRFLEAARKTIKNAELEAGSRLNTDQGMDYMQRAAASRTGTAEGEEEKKEEEDPQ